MRLRRPRAAPAAAEAPKGKRRRGTFSLFGEILDWMLAPLLFLWPISIVVTYDVASRIANQPYDKALHDQVRALARQVHVRRNGSVYVDLPPSASRVLRSDAEDTVYFQIVSPEGDLLAGDTEIPLLPRSTQLIPGQVQFRDGEIQGEDIRIAYMPIIPDDTHPARFGMVQVAETRHKRSSLSTRIVSGVLLPQFLIIPIAVVLVWFGLSRGIAPLNRLQDVIRHRRPGDLSPVAPDSVPEEVRPLIVAFNDMMARLEDNLQAQQRFIADAAHQMRTPLAGLKMQAELALLEPDPEQMRMALRRVHAGAERSVRLTNQLLALARAEASSEKLYVFEPVELGSLIREVMADHVPLALAKGIDLGVEGLEQEVWMEGARVLLDELLTNLVDNAVKYTRGGGRVTVGLHADPDDARYALLTVRDNGPGVPLEARERVFERFYRVLGSGAEGSGLGLSIVREVAELHGGSATLGEGEEGRGVCVTVRLPLVRAVSGDA